MVDHTKFPYRCDDTNKGGFTDFWNYTGVIPWSQEAQADVEKKTGTTCKQLDFLSVDHQVSLLGATWDDLDSVALRRVGALFSRHDSNHRLPDRIAGVSTTPQMSCLCKEHQNYTCAARKTFLMLMVPRADMQIWHLQPDVQREVDAALRDMRNWKAPTIAFHVRGNGLDENLLFSVSFL